MSVADVLRTIVSLQKRVEHLERFRNPVSGGAGGGHQIRDNGVPMPQRAGLNFIGTDVSDDAINNATVVGIAAFVQAAEPAPTWAGQIWVDIS